MKCMEINFVTHRDIKGTPLQVWLVFKPMLLTNRLCCFLTNIKELNSLLDKSCSPEACTLLKQSSRCTYSLPVQQCLPLPPLGKSQGLEKDGVSLVPYTLLPWALPPSQKKSKYSKSRVFQIVSSLANFFSNKSTWESDLWKAAITVIFSKLLKVYLNWDDFHQRKFLVCFAVSCDCSCEL